MGTDLFLLFQSKNDPVKLLIGAVNSNRSKSKPAVSDGAVGQAESGAFSPFLVPQIQRSATGLIADSCISPATPCVIPITAPESQLPPPALGV